MPPGSSAMAKAGRPKRSLSRAATSPTTPGCQPSAAVTTTAPFSSSPSAAMASASACATRRLLDRLALAVEPVELGGDARGLDRVVLQQQPHAEIGAADAAAGIDARAEQEAEMPGLRRAGEPRRIHQRGQPDLLAPAQRDQALGDEGAVEAVERHHVGDGAERDQIEQRQQIGLGPRRGPEAALAQLAVDRDQREEHEPDGGEMAEPGEIVGAVRIDDRHRRRQFLVGLMMVDDDDVEAELLRLGERLDGWWCRNRP